MVPIDYTSRDQESIRNDLDNYAKNYYPEIYKNFSDNSFEILGRFDNSDLRGCNLLIQ